MDFGGLEDITYGRIGSTPLDVLSRFFNLLVFCSFVCTIFCLYLPARLRGGGGVQRFIYSADFEGSGFPADKGHQGLQARACLYVSG